RRNLFQLARVSISRRGCSSHCALCRRGDKATRDCELEHDPTGDVRSSNGNWTMFIFTLDVASLPRGLAQQARPAQSTPATLLAVYALIQVHGISKSPSRPEHA